MYWYLLTILQSVVSALFGLIDVFVSFLPSKNLTQQTTQEHFFSCSNQPTLVFSVVLILVFMVPQSFSSAPPQTVPQGPDSVLSKH